MGGAERSVRGAERKEKWGGGGRVWPIGIFVA